MRKLRESSGRLEIVTTVMMVVLAASLARGVYAQGTADTYPTKPVRIVVPLAAGGGTDITARMIAARLSIAMNRQFIVENRLGAAGTVAFGSIAKSLADGYTLLVTGSGFATTAALYTKLAYDPIKDFSPITLINRSPYLLVVHPSLPVKTPRELVALAKARPGVINFGSSGYGSGVHFAEELFRIMAGVNLMHVPYKGAGEAEIDLIAGRIEMMMGGILSALPHVKNGRLRLLAVSTAQRSPILPNIPSVAESGVPGYEAVSWGGMLGPAGMQPEVISKIQQSVATIMKEPEVAKKTLDDGAEPVGNRPDEFRQFIAADIARNRKVARDAGLKVDN